MSITAAKYALDVLEADHDLPQGARAILLALSIRANVHTHDTFTGGWLCRAAGMNDVNVRRNVARLVERGYVAAVHRPGLASVIRFPFASSIATVPAAIGDPPGSRRDSQGQMHPKICGCPECLAAAM